MKKKRVFRKTEGKTKGRRTRRRVIIASAVLLAVAVLVTVLCLVFLGGRVVMRYGGIEVREELYTYWLSWYKYTYLSAHASEGALDLPEYWAQDSGDGRTNEEVCRAGAEEYMATVIAAASLYEKSGGSLTATEREELTADAGALLRYEVSTVSAFNKYAKPFGFDYTAVRRAMLYIAEAGKLNQLLSGSGGSTLTDAQLTAYCESEFLQATFLEVRTGTKILLDGDGEPTVDTTDGSYVMVELTEEEKETAADLITDIRASLTENGTEANFVSMAELYNEDVNRDTYTDGYYFSSGSDFTALFAEELPEIAAGILAQTPGSWTSYDTGVSTLFVYVEAAEGTPFSDDGNADFFTDLRTDAAGWIFLRQVTEKIADVTVRRKVADAVDLVSLPVDPLLYAR